jgi:hypothetical protein
MSGEVRFAEKSKNLMNLFENFDPLSAATSPKSQETGRLDISPLSAADQNFQNGDIRK